MNDNANPTDTETLDIVNEVLAEQDEAVRKLEEWFTERERGINIP